MQRGIHGILLVPDIDNRAVKAPGCMKQSFFIMYGQIYWKKEIQSLRIILNYKALIQSEMLVIAKGVYVLRSSHPGCFT
jgi:hypothetical protein